MGAIGKYRGNSMAPGRHMPNDMHAIGMALHRAAVHFAEVARQGDAMKAYAAFQGVTSQCVACHAAYRVR